MAEVFLALDSQQVLKLAENSSNILIHDDNLCSKNEDGDIVYCPHLEVK